MATPSKEGREANAYQRRLFGFTPFYTTRLVRESETGMAPLQRWSEGGFLPQLPASLEQPWACCC